MTLAERSGDSRFTSESNPSARGRQRMAQLAAEDKLEIEKLTAHLVQGLKRPATAGEEIEAELIGTTFVRARRLRGRGRDDSKERRLLKELMKTTIYGSVPEPSPAERQHGKAVADAVDEHNRQHRINALRGWRDE